MLFFIGKSLESRQRVIDVNLTGVMLTNQAVARKMRDNGGGTIVNLSSIVGTNVLKGSSDYCVSKAGAWMLTRCVALELSRYGIRVNAVGPGYTQTSMSGAVLGNERWVQARERETPLGRLGEPNDIANACLYLCSDDASFVTDERADLADDGVELYRDISVLVEFVECAAVHAASVDAPLPNRCA